MYFYLTVFFIFANLFGLLTRSVAWDSRLWFTHIKNQDIDTLYWFLNQAKLVGQFQIFSFLSYFKDPLFIANAGNFLFWLLITLFFYWFVTELKLGTPMSRFVASCWVALKPSLLVSYELCHMPYNLGILLYCLGIWSFLTYGKNFKPKTFGFAIYFIALFILWNSSFVLLRSLMFLHYGFIVILFINKNINYKQLCLFALLPIVSWIFKGVPTGVYANYNQVDLSHVNLYNLRISLRETNWVIFNKTTKWIWKDIGLVLAFLAALPMVYLMLRKVPKPEKPVTNKIAGMNLFVWAGCCLFFILFLIFPYLTTGIVLVHDDFESRHAILHVFPQALILIALGQFFEWRKWLRFEQVFFTVLLSMFLIAMVENQRRWQIDGFVQDSIVQNLKSLPFDRSVSTLVFDHQALNWHQLNRRPNIYEYNGLLDAALGEQKWIGIDQTVLKSLSSIPPYMLVKYACKNCVATEKMQLVVISKGEANPYSWSVYGPLIWNEYFNKEKYNQLAKELLNFELKDLKF